MQNAVRDYGPTHCHKNFQLYLHQEWKANQYHKFYTITISPHDNHGSTYILRQSIIDLFRVCKNVVSMRYIYETSKNNKLHIHGLLTSKDYCKFMKVRKHPLVKFHIVQYTPGNWIDYISKEKPNQVHDVIMDNDIGKRNIIIESMNLDYFINMDD